MYSILYRQIIPRPIEQTWDFFSNPANLKLLTPAGMKFELMNESIDEMYEGIVLGYTLAPLAGIKLSWYSEITKIEAKKYFIDQQLKGPFKIWHHQHHFRETDSGTEVTDLVHYELPLGFIGKLFHPLFVERRVKDMFEYRYQKARELFGSRD